MQLKGNNSSVLVIECFFCDTSTHCELKKMEIICFNFFYLFQKLHSYLLIIKKWGEKKN